MDVALIKTSITISILRKVKIYFKIARDIKVWNLIWSWEWQKDTDSLICLGASCVPWFVMNRKVMRRKINLILQLLKRLKEQPVVSLIGFKLWSFYDIDFGFFLALCWDVRSLDYFSTVVLNFWCIVSSKCYFYVFFLKHTMNTKYLILKSM